MPARKPPKPPDPDALKRERAGRYVTADSRFAVEGESTGSWYVIDNARQNDFGLPVMDGPLATLDAARTRVAEIRAGTEAGRAEAPAQAPEPEAAAPQPSGDVARAPAGRVRRRAEPQRTVVERSGSSVPMKPTHEPAASQRPERAEPAQPEPLGRERTRSDHAARAEQAGPEPQEPAWLGRLGSRDQATARHLLATLDRLGLADPSLVRRDVEGNVPEVAGALLARRIRREALDMWRTPGGIRKALADLVRAAPGHLRPTTQAGVDAAERALEQSRDEADTAALAWAVAVRTAVAVLEAIDREADESRVAGEPGWRLVELDGRREPTGRTITLDAADVMERSG